MKRARFIAPARKELLAEVAYYNGAQPGLGRRFVEAIQQSTARALAFPLSGSRSFADTRFVVVRGFPFSIFYRPEQNGIIVFAVAHHARKPGYWRARVKDR